VRHDIWYDTSSDALNVFDGSVWKPLLNGTFVSGQGHVYQGATDPETLPTEQKPSTGAEYVWFKTDGSGNLLDILAGVSA
jgi:hypothetical protein